MTETDKAGETPPNPTPKKRAGPKWMNVYNGSMNGQNIKDHQGGIIKPGKMGKVPYALGKTMVERVRWIKRAERGDTMG